VRFFADGLRRLQLRNRQRPLVEFRVPPESSSANPSHPATARQHLSWALIPYSTFEIRRSTCRKRLPTPATFRLQGLVTLLTAFARQIRVGPISCRQRSWDSPFGVFPSQKVSGTLRTGRTHIPFCRPLYQPPEGGRPARSAAVSGLQPFREFLASAAGLARPSAGYSLGFFPFRALTMTTSAELSPDLLSRASQRRISHDSSRRRLRVSISHHRDPSGAAAASCNGRMSQPSWGFVHRLAPGHSDVRHPGYFFRLAPRRTSLSTAGTLWVIAHVLLTLLGPA